MRQMRGDGWLKGHQANHINTVQTCTCHIAADLHTEDEEVRITHLTGR